jgi:hypothetical protein
MFCPKCATQNVENAHYCRSCGANISLIPNALNGELPVAVEKESRGERRRRRRNKPPSLDEGIRSLMTGFGFIAVALALASFGGPIGARVWWFWLLIPAFATMGKGISEIVRARQMNSPAPPNPQLPHATTEESLPASKTSELRPPVPSVTEGTTRHLGAEAPTRHFDPWDDQKPS